MNPGFPAFHNLCWFQRGQVLQPQACGFYPSMTEHPGLDDLVGLPVQPRHDTDRILDRNPRNGRVDASHEEFDGFLLAAIGLLGRKPACPRYR